MTKKVEFFSNLNNKCPQPTKIKINKEIKVQKIIEYTYVFPWYFTDYAENQHYQVFNSAQNAQTPQNAQNAQNINILWGCLTSLSEFSKEKNRKFIISLIKKLGNHSWDLNTLIYALHQGYDCFIKFIKEEKIFNISNNMKIYFVDFYNLK
jgi:hypothetical protein